MGWCTIDGWTQQAQVYHYTLYHWWIATIELVPLRQGHNQHIESQSLPIKVRKCNEFWSKTRWDRLVRWRMIKCEVKQGDFKLVLGSWLVSGWMSGDRLTEYSPPMLVEENIHPYNTLSSFFGSRQQLPKIGTRGKLGRHSCVFRWHIYFHLSSPRLEIVDRFPTKDDPTASPGSHAQAL